MEKEYLDLMLSIARQGGGLAMGLIEDSSPSFKGDRTVLTKADLAISELTRQTLAPLLATKEHLLIDEEGKDLNKYFNRKLLENTPYTWVLDPIDGTRSFANRIPLFGISLGLLKEMKPWLGVVYFPMLGELFFCDGQRSYFVQDAFSSRERKRPIVPIDEQISRQSIFFGTDAFFRYFEWDFTFCSAMLASCAVVDLCWPAIGRGCGSVFKSNLWDLAGSWPIYRSAGMELRSFESGKAADRLDLDHYIGKDDKTWRFKEFHLLSSERNFDLLRAKITPKI